MIPSAQRTEQKSQLNRIVKNSEPISPTDQSNDIKITHWNVSSLRNPARSSAGIIFICFEFQSAIINQMECSKCFSIREIYSNTFDINEWMYVRYLSAQIPFRFRFDTRRSIILCDASLMLCKALVKATRESSFKANPIKIIALMQNSVLWGRGSKNNFFVEVAV